MASSNDPLALTVHQQSEQRHHPALAGKTQAESDQRSHGKKLQSPEPKAGLQQQRTEREQMQKHPSLAADKEPGVHDAAD